MKRSELKRTPFKCSSNKKPSKGLLNARRRRAAEKKAYKENETLWSLLVKMRARYQSEKPATQMELLEHPSRRLNSHHFFRKELYPSMRWEVRDGIAIYSWQHILARGSAHDDPATFDAWAIPYMKKRHDFGYLEKRTRMPGKVGPIQIAEANVALRKLYLKQTGHEWGAQ